VVRTGVAEKGYSPQDCSHPLTSDTDIGSLNIVARFPVNGHILKSLLQHIKRTLILICCNCPSGIRYIDIINVLENIKRAGLIKDPE
jgi:hypothetical protein